MAFTAKDGSKHTNKDTMTRSNARFSASQPPPAAAPAPEEQGEEGQPEHEGGGLQELEQRFTQFMQEMASGQPPDPENCRALAEAFTQFVGEETQEQG